jgi:hypothetical protein
LGDDVRTPSRDRFRSAREERRQATSNRRRLLIGVPLVLLGIALMVAGAWVFLKNGDTSDTPGTRVGGSSIVRETTTVATSVPASDQSTPVAGSDGSSTTAPAESTDNLGASIPVLNGGGPSTTVPAAP